MQHSINERSISEAHSKLVHHVIQYGQPVLTEDREFTVELTSPLCVHVDRPMEPERILRSVGMSQAFMDSYAQQLRSITQTGFSYTYGNRLCDYPEAHGHLLYTGNGDGNGIDQIQSVINRLNCTPTTRRAIMHTWVVPIDIKAEHVPCMQTVQFLIRNNRLNCVATFRSNDMLMAWGANAYGLSELMQVVADGTYVDVGFLETYSISAHIYYNRDSTTLDKVLVE